jgi:hypothetical protein
VRIVVAEAVVELTSAEDRRLEADSIFVTLAVVDVVSKDVAVTSVTAVVELMVVEGTTVVAYVLVYVGVLVVTPPEIQPEIPPEMPPEIPPEIPPDTPPEIQPEPDNILAEPSYLIRCRCTDFGKR